MSAPARCINQAVVLCGGLGTRLGALTAVMPKPLLPIADRPFLERLLFESRRFGITRILLLAAHLAEEIERFAADVASRLGLEIEISVEPERADTGGALWHARERLDEVFFLFNGDSWFDFNLLDLALLAEGHTAVVAMALRHVEDAGRYGTVEVAAEQVVRFGEKEGLRRPGLVNSGVYVVRREVIGHLTPRCSFERDVLTPLTSKGGIFGRVYQGFFIDIGVPDEYQRAQQAIPAAQTRGAVFLDRDGVLNEDHGYLGKIERFVWLPTAKASIKRINDLGYFAFVVTNQAGVAHGFHTEASVRLLHALMQGELARIGAHLDDFRFYPYHPDACQPEYGRHSDWRKPAPGMLTDLMKTWPVDRARSVMIGDQEKDVLAGEAAGVRAYRLGADETLEQALERTVFASK